MVAFICVSLPVLTPTCHSERPEELVLSEAEGSEESPFRVEQARFFVKRRNRLTGDERIQHIRVDVCFVGPANGAHIWIDVHLGKVGTILERCEDTGKRDELGQVYNAFNAVFGLNV
jgi:hypothetical protein